MKAAPEIHPHEFQGSVPDRLPVDVIRELSVLRRSKSIQAILVEWLGIAGAIALCESFWHPVLYAFAILWIGARQHALTILGHDAAHFRLFFSHDWNDRIGNWAVMWPVFLSVESYRLFHGEHHRFTGTPADGNRTIWKTHTAGGELTAEWTYPKTRTGLVLTVLRRAALLTGLFWILRGFVASFLLRRSWGQFLFRMAYYGALFWIIAALGVMRDLLLYWIVPYCTAHIAYQYVRLICEHSGVHSDDPAYSLTRTTLARWWERWFIVPCYSHYHAEHHWYPSVPFYNLPALHDVLMAQPRFRRYAVVTPSLTASIRQCIVKSL